MRLQGQAVIRKRCLCNIDDDPDQLFLFSSFEKKGLSLPCLALLALHHGLYHRGVAQRHRAAAATAAAAFEGTAELFSCRCILRGSDSFLKSAFCAMILA